MHDEYVTGTKTSVNVVTINEDRVRSGDGEHFGLFERWYFHNLPFHFIYRSFNHLYWTIRLSKPEHYHLKDVFLIPLKSWLS